MSLDAKHPVEGAGPNVDDRAARDSVDIAFFDPAGMQELGRQLSRSSTRDATAIGHGSRDADSEFTIRVDEKFDFGRFARGMMRK